MTDPETTLLEQAQARAGELMIKASGTREQAQGELSLTAGGPSWAATLWARLTVQNDTKPDPAFGISVSKRWLLGAPLPGWRDPVRSVVRWLWNRGR